MLAEGDKLPTLDLVDDEGRTISSADLLGGPMVLYFYPKKGARARFLIDGKGKIVKVWPKVKVDVHAGEVLASLP